jgi:hypothetical protein
MVDHQVPVAYLASVMSRRGNKHKGPKLPKALVEELALQNLTYEEAIKGCDVIPDHQTLLKVLRGWRLLTPEQKAAWDLRATEYNLAGGDPDAAN